jgi:hypothetical protein
VFAGTQELLFKVHRVPVGENEKVLGVYLIPRKMVEMVNLVNFTPIRKKNPL